MPGRPTDREWEALGKNDPFWAVCTEETFRRPAMDAAGLEAFVALGRSHVQRVWEVVEGHLGGPFAPRTALDFGCGVGRVLIPLAQRCPRVVGVDVAESMLAEARALCERFGVQNVGLVKGDDTLSRVEGTFDLVHSCIVFQHIPRGRGMKLLKGLIGRLNEGGVGVLHVLHHNPRDNFPLLRQVKALIRHVANLSRRVPRMQMNPYPLNDVFRLLHAAGVRQSHCLLTDHGGCEGVVLCFRKTPGAPHLV